MKTFRRILMVIIVSVLANVASCSVLENNLNSGVYSPNADSLSIPIYENAVASLVIVLLLTGCAFCNRGGKFVASISLLLGVLATILSVLLALDWAVPNHFVIAASFGFLAAVSAMLAYFPLRRLASNNSFKRDA